MAQFKYEVTIEVDKPMENNTDKFLKDLAYVALDTSLKMGSIHIKNYTIKDLNNGTISKND